MKNAIIFFLVLFPFMQLRSQTQRENLIPESDWQIRLNTGLSFANRVCSGESAWYSNPEESSCGNQYGIDLFHYHKGIGYGLVFKHYMHGLSFPPSLNNSALHEDVRLFYVAPQFSYIEECFWLKGLTSNVDLGIGYARYASEGTIGERLEYSAPRSGFGINFNMGFEYKFRPHWGARFSLSAEYCFFKKLHQGKQYPAGAFRPRTKLDILVLTPQLGITYHL